MEGMLLRQITTANHVNRGAVHHKAFQTRDKDRRSGDRPGGLSTNDCDAAGIHDRSGAIELLRYLARTAQLSKNGAVFVSKADVLKVGLAILPDPLDDMSPCARSHTLIQNLAEDDECPTVDEAEVLARLATMQMHLTIDVRDWLREQPHEE